MKQNIHPNWHNDTVVTCVCGNTFTTGSTQATIEVDICAACHPFFTNEMRFVDRQGRVDKFRKQVERAKAAQESGQGTKKSKKQQQDDKSFQEILEEHKENV